MVTAAVMVPVALAVVTEAVALAEVALAAAAEKGKLGRPERRHCHIQDNPSCSIDHHTHHNGSCHSNRTPYTWRGRQRGQDRETQHALQRFLVTGTSEDSCRSM